MILFCCVGNAFQSPLLAALYNAEATALGLSARATSAGLTNRREMPPTAAFLLAAVAQEVRDRPAVYAALSVHQPTPLKTLPFAPVRGVSYLYDPSRKAGDLAQDTKVIEKWLAPAPETPVMRLAIKDAGYEAWEAAGKPALESPEGQAVLAVYAREVVALRALVHALVAATASEPQPTPAPARVSAPAIDAPRAEHERDEHTEAQHREAQHTEAQHTEAQHTEAQRTEAQHIEAQHIEATRAEAAREEAARVETARLEAARAEAARVEAARMEAARVERARLEAERLEAARLEAAREAARVEAARAEAARLEALHAERMRVAAAQAEAARLETARLETARLETARVETARVETARVETARVPTARVPTARVETPRVGTASVEAAPAPTAPIGTARLDPQMEAARIAAEAVAARIEGVRAEAARMKAAREAARAEAARVASTQGASTQGASTQGASTQAAPSDTDATHEGAMEAAYIEVAQALAESLKARIEGLITASSDPSTDGATPAPAKTNRPARVSARKPKKTPQDPATASRDEVLDDVRAWVRAALPVTRATLTRYGLWQRAEAQFGSWAEAVSVAGIPVAAEPLWTLPRDRELSLDILIEALPDANVARLADLTLAKVRARRRANGAPDPARQLVRRVVATDQLGILPDEAIAAQLGIPAADVATIREAEGIAPPA